MKRIENLAQQLVDSVAKNDFEKVKALTAELKDNVNTHIAGGQYNALTEAISHSNKTLLKLLLEKANNDTKQRTLDYALAEKETEMTEIISKSIVADHQALFEVIEQVALNGEVSE